MSRTAGPTDLDDLERALLAGLASLAGGGAGDPSVPLAPGSSLTVERLDGLFDAQLASRHLDHTARWLRAKGRGFYTIGSAGHEANALVAAALRPTDPALLHYRSGGFYLARAQQVPGHDGVRDVLLGLLAAADEPIAGGRHKVFGHPDLAVIPQTSTIASHLPRAMGVAFAIGRARRLGLPTRWPADALAVCSFGDASLNHSTAQGALNAAAYTAHQGMPMPLLLRVRGQRVGDQRADARRVGRHVAVGPARDCATKRADGADPVGVFDVTEDLADWVRCVRQAGGAAPAHRPLRRPRRHRRRDGLPLGRRRSGPTSTATRCWRPPACSSSTGAPPPTASSSATSTGGPTCARGADELAGCRRLADGGRGDGAAVATPAGGRRRTGRSPARARRPGRVLRSPARGRGTADTGRVDQPHARRPARRRPCGARVRRGRRRQGRRLRRHPRAATPSRASRGCSTRCSTSSRSSAWRSAPGVSGLVPIPEIQYLAYLHNAEDQLRGEAASLSFFSNGAVHQPARRAHRRLRLPEGVRRALPQRQRRRRAPRHPRPRDRLAGSCRRRPGDAAHVRRRGRGRRHGERVPRADRPVPHARSARAGRRCGGRAEYAARRAMAERARPDRRGERRPRRRRRARRHVGQRPVHVAARRRATGC